MAGQLLNHRQCSKSSTLLVTCVVSGSDSLFKGRARFRNVFQTRECDAVRGQGFGQQPQFIALFPLTLFPHWPTLAVIVSFILFRFFDIVKPYPAREMERLHGGLGIMSDDWVAGIYAATVLSIAAEAMRFL